MSLIVAHTCMMFVATINVGDVVCLRKLWQICHITTLIIDIHLLRDRGVEFPWWVVIVVVETCIYRVYKYHMVAYGRFDSWLLCLNLIHLIFCAFNRAWINSYFLYISPRLICICKGRVFLIPIFAFTSLGFVALK